MKSKKLSTLNFSKQKISVLTSQIKGGKNNISGSEITGPSGCSICQTTNPTTTNQITSTCTQNTNQR